LEIDTAAAVGRRTESWGSPFSRSRPGRWRSPFATAVLAGALRSGNGLRIAVVFYGIAFDAIALTLNGLWQFG
jgi:hypothetical protein